jgi:hypothetical protein
MAPLDLERRIRQPFFLIRETQARIAMIPGDKMHVEIRSSLIIFDNVALIPLLAQIDNNPGLTYQSKFKSVD